MTLALAHMQQRTDELDLDALEADDVIERAPGGVKVQLRTVQ